MSSKELVPLFPSALHPALPIASQILSTLRNLTAPGRGNDLPPEERAALVGISALLGCERVQSKDLVESSAQKASSVSPARFKSALLKSRRILESASVGDPSLDASTSRRGSSASPSTRSTRSTRSHADQADADQVANTGEKRGSGPSPFSTPRKRFKYSSGIDISGLVKGGLAGGGSPPNTPKHQHEPSTGSPLRQSVTPSSRRVRSALRGGRVTEKKNDEEDGVVKEDEIRAGSEAEAAMIDEDAMEVDGQEERTPTKRVKFGVRQGVDLAIATEELDETPRTRSKRLDTSAFFALRPGASPSGSTARSLRNAQTSSGMKSRSIPVEDGLPEIRAPRANRSTTTSQKLKRRKRDWTYAERIWGLQTDESREAIRKFVDGLPAWLEAHGRPSLDETAVSGETIENVLLSASNK
ncbi:hypothetical protein BD324DRAFT_650922 [Kockovaella imperatae]|uniref:Uncharacterized protein n=1 Tax=Kockovaella imperatae TaxID=4999 RepID=A0A1Y1UH23_9TREE|nr:hypothetical protein BD324DRAFT_650922 [Kockovaella imperatae]ORX37322.1 hypothetical protein BD324DRAFT_650922 [Kockovaella imperatae]